MAAAKQDHPVDIRKDSEATEVRKRRSSLARFLPPLKKEMTTGCDVSLRLGHQLFLSPLFAPSSSTQPPIFSFFICVPTQSLVRDTFANLQRSCSKN